MAPSPAGWALTTLPTRVAELRIWRDPTVPQPWAREGKYWRTRGERAMVVRVTAAPMTSLPFSTVMPHSSGTRVTSTHTWGCTFPALKSTIRSVPPD